MTPPRSPPRGLPGHAMLLLLIVGGLTGCQPRPGLTFDEQARVDGWLECIECSEGELDSIRTLAQVKPVLVDTLAARFRHGPANTRLVAVELALAMAYVADTAWYRTSTRSADSSGVRDSASYVSSRTERFVTMIRERAAEALGCIGSDTALALLADPDAAVGLPPAVTDWLSMASDSLARQGYRTSHCR